MERERRLSELDLARGIAVVMMLGFNWLYALGFLGLLSPASFDPQAFFWWVFARATAFAFVFISGFSLWLSYSKHSDRREGLLLVELKMLFRGVKLFALGMLATLATWVFARQGTVFFGVLHLLGLSAVLAIPVASWTPRRKIALAFVCVAAGFALSSVSFDFPWLLWLGFSPKGFASFDYLPVLPWFGVFLAGNAAGQAYRASKRGLQWADRLGEAGGKSVSLPHSVSAPLRFLGRHSLAVYVLHQPLLIGVLYALGFNPLGLPVIAL